MASRTVTIPTNADNVILIHRPEFEERRKSGYVPEGPEPAELIVAKNRQGPVGTVEVFYDAGTMTFRCKEAHGGAYV